MAEGWSRALKSESVEPYSAGIEQRGVNPSAIRVMGEAGVDITRQSSKRVEDVLDIRFDYVVTVCDHAAEHCPVFPARVAKMHVPFDDPPLLAKDATSEDEALQHYRRVRDEIRVFVETLPAALEESSRTSG